MPLLPLDIVYAIAELFLTQEERRQQKNATLAAMSSVCHEWREAVIPLLFKTLYIPYRQERACLAFLKTSTGRAIRRIARTLYIKTLLETLAPQLVGLLSRLPCLERIELSITTFVPIPFTTFKQTLPKGYLGRFSMDHILIRVPKVRDTASFLKLIAFLNFFADIGFLHLNLDSWSSSRRICSPELTFTYPLSYGEDPEIIVPQAAIRQLFIWDFRKTAKFIAPALLNALCIGPMAHSFIAIAAITQDRRLEAFSALCDLAEKAGGSLLDLELCVWCGPERSPPHHPQPGNPLWDNMWRIWQLQPPKLAHCTSLELLDLHIYVDDKEADWELHFGTWTRALTLIRHISPTLIFLRIEVEGSAIAFLTQFVGMNELTPFSRMLERLDKLETLLFVLDLCDEGWSPLDEEDVTQTAALIRRALPIAEERGILQFELKYIHG